MKKRVILPSSILAALTVILILPSACNKEAATQSQLSSSNNSDALASGNLIAWYSFNGDTKDHSGNNNDVDFINNATPVSGRKGAPNTAYLFDGKSSYMTVPNSVSLKPTNGITIAALVEPMGFYQGVCHSNRILCKGYNDFDNGRYTIGYDDQLYWNFQGCEEPVKEKHQKFYGSYGDGQATASGVIDSNASVHPNQWYLLVYTCDGRNSKFYVNNVLQATAKAPTTFTGNNNPLFIGRNQDPSYPYFFNGIIDEIKIYNKALNPEAISQLQF